eukprot:TRINITY_DN35055_c0_g1_i1.p1 TRINITY_DN35055_c0_g1~~TRINITY_DN35055_c0_g1_i1.p1  ORF type:complete len:177 (+),score=12.35 TRINITY_DN35055_c0_g1_i1:39-569(+)
MLAVWRSHALYRLCQTNGKRAFCSRALAPYTAAEIGLLQSVENTYLSWTRNCLIATSAGLFIIHYNANHGDLQRMPLSGVGVLTIGGVFMLTGSVSYIRANTQLGRIMFLSTAHWCWVWFQATCPQCLWFFSMRCFLYGTPYPVAQFIAANQNSGHLPPFLKEKAPSTTKRLQVDS